MTRILARIVLGLAGLAVLGLVGIAMLVSTISPVRLLADGIEQIEEVSGYTIESQPEASLTYWPRPGIRINALTVRDTAERTIINAPVAVIGLSYSALQSGQIRAGSITLNNPRLDLSAEDFDRVSQDPRANSPWGTVTRFVIQNGQVQIASDTGTVQLNDVAISLDHAGPSRPTIIEGRANWKGHEMRGVAMLETLTALHGGQYALLDASAEFGDAKAALRGRLRLSGDPFPHFRGNGTVTAARPALISELLGQSFPMLDQISDLSTEIEVTTLTDRFWFKTKSTGIVNGRETVLDAVLSADAGWMEGGDLTFDIVSRTGGLYSAYFEGQTNLTDQISGSLKAAVLNVAETATWVAGSELRSNWSRANVTADVSVVQRGVAIQSIDLKLDDKPIKGSIAADMRGERPLISASVQARDMRLPILSWLEGGAVAGYRRRLGDLAEAIALDVALDDIRLEDLNARRVDATVTQRGRAIFVDATRVDVFDGTAAVTLDFEEGRPLPVKGSVKAAELNAAAVSDLFDLDDVSGSLGGEISFALDDDDGSPQLVALSGDLSLFEGVIPLPNLRAVLRGQEPSEQTTKVDRLSGDISLTNGHPLIENLQIRFGDQKLTGSLQVLEDVRSLSGQLDGQNPTDGVTRLEIDGPLGNISATAKQVPTPEDTTSSDPASASDREVDPEVAALEQRPKPTDSGASDDVVDNENPDQRSSPEGSVTSEDDGWTEPVIDVSASEEDLASAAEDGPPAPITLQSPIPRPAPR